MMVETVSGDGLPFILQNDPARQRLGIHTIRAGRKSVNRISRAKQSTDSVQTHGQISVSNSLSSVSASVCDRNANSLVRQNAMSSWKLIVVFVGIGPGHGDGHNNGGAINGISADSVLATPPEDHSSARTLSARKVIQPDGR